MTTRNYYGLTRSHAKSALRGMSGALNKRMPKEEHRRIGCYYNEICIAGGWTGKGDRTANLTEEGLELIGDIASFVTEGVSVFGCRQKTLTSKQVNAILEKACEKYRDAIGRCITLGQEKPEGQGLSGSGQKPEVAGFLSESGQKPDGENGSLSNLTNDVQPSGESPQEDVPPLEKDFVEDDQDTVLEFDDALPREEDLRRRIPPTSLPKEPRRPASLPVGISRGTVAQLKSEDRGLSYKVVVESVVASDFMVRLDVMVIEGEFLGAVGAITAIETLVMGKRTRSSRRWQPYFDPERLGPDGQMILDKIIENGDAQKILIRDGKAYAKQITGQIGRCRIEEKNLAEYQRLMPDYDYNFSESMGDVLREVMAGLRHRVNGIRKGRGKRRGVVLSNSNIAVGTPAVFRTRGVPRCLVAVSHVLSSGRIEVMSVEGRHIGRMGSVYSMHKLLCGVVGSRGLYFDPDRLEPVLKDMVGDIYANDFSQHVQARGDEVRSGTFPCDKERPKIEQMYKGYIGGLLRGYRFTAHYKYDKKDSQRTSVVTAAPSPAAVAVAPIVCEKTISAISTLNALRTASGVSEPVTPRPAERIESKTEEQEQGKTQATRMAILRAVKSNVLSVEDAESIFDCMAK